MAYEKVLEIKQIEPLDCEVTYFGIHSNFFVGHTHFCQGSHKRPHTLRFSSSRWSKYHQTMTNKRGFVELGIKKNIFILIQLKK